MNFCVTDGESVIATRYINSRHDEAASLVGQLFVNARSESSYACSGSHPVPHSVNMRKAGTTGCLNVTNGRI